MKREAMMRRRASRHVASRLPRVGLSRKGTATRFTAKGKTSHCRIVRSAYAIYTLHTCGIMPRLPSILSLARWLRH